MRDVILHGDAMEWMITHQADKRACRLADRHYSRKTRGAPQFVPPGRSLVLLTPEADALWVSSWPKPEYAAYPDAWICTLFRNESAHLSSELIQQAVAATLWKYGPAPAQGMITFIDTRKIRHKRDPGRCYRKAGFEVAGTTKSGHLILRLSPECMPAASIPNNAQLSLFA